MILGNYRCFVTEEVKEHDICISLHVFQLTELADMAQLRQRHDVWRYRRKALWGDVLGGICN